VIAIALVLCLASCGGTATPATAPQPQAVPSVAATTSTTTSVPATEPAPSLSSTSPKAPPPRPVSPPQRPPIIHNPIPFGAKRKAEMVAYAQRHYGLNTYRLIDPHVIVIHYTETPDFQSTFNTFAPDVPDPELHELPNTCAHFVIDKDGTIHQLVPLGIMCRHTVGLNWTAIGIEHVGFSDAEVLSDHAQMRASLRLVGWLRCRFHIKIANVIGHNESLSSPYHHERVARLRTQTHSDFNRADMTIYRKRLSRGEAC